MDKAKVRIIGNGQVSVKSADILKSKKGKKTIELLKSINTPTKEVD